MKEWFVNTWNKPAFAMRGDLPEWGFFWQGMALIYFIKVNLIFIWVFFPSVINKPLPEPFDSVAAKIVVALCVAFVYWGFYLHLNRRG